MTLIRHVTTVGAATLFSRVLGFARDIGIAAVLGAGIFADAFFVAFQIANLTRRLLAEGALNAAMVPLYLRVRDEGGEKAAYRFAGRLVGFMTVVLAALAGVFAICMPFVILLLAPGFASDGLRMSTAIELSRLMLPYLILAGPAAVLIGVLNANHRFIGSGLAAIVFNLTLLLALAIVFWFPAEDSLISARIIAIAVAFAGLSQLLVVSLSAWQLKRRIIPLAISFGQPMRRFARRAVSGVLANALPQMAMIGGVMAASTTQSAISWIYFSNRLIELPLGIIGIAIGTVLAPASARALQGGDKQELTNIESRGLEIALALALPAAVGLFVLAEPIVRVLFERGAFNSTDTQATALALGVFALGLPGHVLVKTFSSLLFARDDSRAPMHASLAGFALALLGSLMLTPRLGHVGIALAIAASGWASAAMLAIFIARQYGIALDDAARRRLPRILFAALLMGLVVASAYHVVAPWLDTATLVLLRASVLLALILLGFTAYVLLLRLFGIMPPRVWTRIKG